MRPLLTAVALGLVMAACTAAPEHLAVVGNHPSALSTGEQRVLVAYRSTGGEDLASPDLTVTLEVSREGADPQVVPTTFMWLDEGFRGLYVATVVFDQPGTWTAVLRPDGRAPTLASPFSVTDEPVTPQVGERAPSVDTFTVADTKGDLAAITTDPDPEPGLYEISLADAVASGRPTVVIFATPRFCTTATCGPMLDVVKQARADLADLAVNWVHVEVYDLSDLSNLALVPAVVAWELPSEPWLFVVDAEGVVSHRFEGVVSTAELAGAVR